MSLSLLRDVAMVSPIQPLSRQWSRRLLTTIGKWVAIALAIWNLGSAPAIALTSELPSPAVEVAPAPRSPDASAVPAEKVTQFVHAYLQVLTLLDRRESELRQAETETEASRLEQEIELEAFGAIEQAGLKPQEYIQLLGLANSDPEFGERVAARLQELETEIQP